MVGSNSGYTALLPKGEQNSVGYCHASEALDRERLRGKDICQQRGSQGALGVDRFIA